MSHRLIAVGLVALAGCASATSGAPELESPGYRSVTRVESQVGSHDFELYAEGNMRSATLSAPPAQVWPALVEVFAELGIPTTTADPATHSLGATKARIRRFGSVRPSRYLDCGRNMAGANADLYDVYLTLLARLSPAAGGATELRIALEASARDPAVGNAPVRCSSLGQLEQSIVAGVRSRIGG